MNNCSSIIGFICGIVITAIGLIISIIFIPKYLWDGNKIISICNIVLAFGVLATIYYSQATLNNQRTQWLNDAFIKHESDVLLEFRIASGEAQEAISFFLHNILTPVKMDASINENPVIKREKVVKYFNDINKLNKLYNKNQYIFRKHNLEKSISSLTCLLDVGKMLPDGDLELKIVKQDGEVKTYQLVEWNKIIQTFTLSAYFLLNEDKAANPVEQLKNKDINAEFNQLKSFVSSKLTSLVFELDKLTLYNDTVKQTNLNIRQSKYYEDS